MKTVDNHSFKTKGDASQGEVLWTLSDVKGNTMLSGESIDEDLFNSCFGNEGGGFYYLNFADKHRTLEVLKIVKE